MHLVKEVVSQMHDVSLFEGVTPTIVKTRKRRMLLHSSEKELSHARTRNAENRSRRFTNLRSPIKSLAFDSTNFLIRHYIDLQLSKKRVHHPNPIVE